MPLIIKTARATILYVQPEMKSRSPPGQFHHEPPLVATINNIVEWEVIRQSSVRVTPLLYLVFLLMYLHKLVSQNFWTPCNVHFEKQTSVDN